MAELVFLEKMSDEKTLTREKSVFNFNHIDPKNLERKEELEKLFAFYHKLWFCYRKVFYRKKKINLALNLISVSLVTTGTIVGGVTMNVIILGVISGAGVILKTAMEMKNLQQKIENSKLAFTSYAKVLSDLRNFLRGEEWHKEEYLQKLKTLDDMVIEMGLNWEKFVGQYRKEYDV